MPQLSLYLNESTMAVLKSECREAGSSLSRYVSDLITTQRAEKLWPEGYWDGVYGALSDDSFRVPEEPAALLDGELPSF